MIDIEKMQMSSLKYEDEDEDQKVIKIKKVDDLDLSEYK